MGVADPYLPFREMFAMLTGDWQRPWLGGPLAPDHAQRLRTVAPRTDGAIALYAPDLIDIMVPRTAVAHALGAQARGSRDLNQRQIFEQTTQLLRALASGQPLLLLLDDLQWVDTASANLLFHLGRQLANCAVLIIGAYRPSEVGSAAGAVIAAPPHPLVPMVQELVRYQRNIEIELSASNSAEGREFVDALLDSEPNRLNASFREAMFRRTRGHPLFTVELLRTLQEQGDLRREERGLWTVAPKLDWDILPARVEAVIARRIERLPPRLRQLLEVASVEGESFSAEVVARVQGMQLRPLLQQLSQELERG